MGAFNKEDVIYLILSRDVYSTFSLLVRPVGAGRAFLFSVGERKTGDKTDDGIGNPKRKLVPDITKRAPTSLIMQREMNVRRAIIGNTFFLDVN